MQITYDSNKLSKSVSTPREIQRNYGTKAKLVNQRLAELTAASNLGVLKTIPKANCHELSGKRKGQLAVDISGNHRIIFQPNHEPFPRKDDGGLDWNAITSILIVGIGEDYH